MICIGGGGKQLHIVLTRPEFQHYVTWLPAGKDTVPLFALLAQLVEVHPIASQASVFLVVCSGHTMMPRDFLEVCSVRDAVDVTPEVAVVRFSTVATALRLSIAQ